MPPTPLSGQIGTSHILANDGAEQRMDQPQDALCGPRAVITASQLARAGKNDKTAFLRMVRD